MAEVVRLVTNPEREKIKKILDEMMGEDAYDLDEIIAQQRETEALMNATPDERRELYHRMKRKYGDGFAACGPGIPED